MNNFSLFRNKMARFIFLKSNEKEKWKVVILKLNGDLQAPAPSNAKRICVKREPAWIDTSWLLKSFLKSFDEFFEKFWKKRVAISAFVSPCTLWKKNNRPSKQNVSVSHQKISQLKPVGAHFLVRRTVNGKNKSYKKSGKRVTRPGKLPPFSCVVKLKRKLSQESPLESSKVLMHRQ